MKTPLKTTEESRRPDTTEVLPLAEYDLIIVSFSGGKDSVYLALDAVERMRAEGIPLERLQLWHQHVDGEPGADAPFMDWPCTESYCRAFAARLGVRLLFQWRHGGFLREMTKEGERLAPVSFDRQDGTVGTAGGLTGKVSTRRRFPQTTADLSVRWCSSALKIDAMARAVANDPALRGAKILILTGERREESTARSRYAEKEVHRCSTRSRRVDQWRSAIDATEAEVWAKMKAHGINPHPAYHLGWGRVSCMACIFGLADQWASVRAIAPDVFDAIASYEMEFGSTIKQGETVLSQADRGTRYEACGRAELVRLALSRHYPADLIAVDPADWRLPAGAFARCGGPV